MNQSLQTAYADRFGSGVSIEQRNRVLRNTYWLLALSMVPTVAGAWLGVSTGLVRGLGVGVSAIVFLAGAFGFIFAIEKLKNSAAGVPVLLAFTFFMGLMLSRLLAQILGFSNGSSLIMTAFGGTAVCWPGGTLREGTDAGTTGAGCAFGLGAIRNLVAEPIAWVCEPVCDTSADCRAGEECGRTSVCAPPCTSENCPAPNRCAFGRCVNERRWARADCDGDGELDCEPYLQCDASEIGGCGLPPRDEE